MLLARSCSCEARRVVSAGAYTYTDTCHSTYDLDVSAAKTARLIVLQLFGVTKPEATCTLILNWQLDMTLRSLIHTERTIKFHM